MAYRILVQLFFFILPFLVFGVYRLLVADAEADGRKAWPVHILFGVGAALAAIVWIVFIFSDQDERGVCYVPSRIENGVFIPAETIPCDQDVSGLGEPLDSDPGGEAQGVSQRETPDEPVEP